MQTIDRILVPVDFSPQSRAAVDQSAVFGRVFRAQVDVVHVVRRAGDSTEAEQQFVAFGASDGGSRMRDYLDWLDDCGVRVRGRLHLSRLDPAHAIVTLVEQEHYDMVVIGTHGRTGLSHWFHPSIAERVVRLASCPVLTVRVADRPRAATFVPMDDLQPPM